MRVKGEGEKNNNLPRISLEGCGGQFSCILRGLYVMPLYKGKFYELCFVTL